MFTRGDDNYQIVSINFDFKFFNNIFTSLTINTNGYVYFNGLAGCCSITLPTLTNSISALNYDLDARTSGAIYYQNLNSSSSGFSSIKSDLNRLNSSFIPANMFRITFDNVPTYSYSSILASFQIVLASDSSRSYVLLKYTSCLSSSVTLSTSPGLYYLSTNGQQLSMLVANPCTSSNVNLVGTWVFDVSSN